MGEAQEKPIPGLGAELRGRPGGSKHGERTLSKFNKFVGSALALTVFAFLAVIATGTPAQAANVGCNVTQVEYYPGTLLIQCPAGNFLAQQNPPSGCGAYTHTLETQKLWLSMAQSAITSGKPVFFYYETCGGINMITVLNFGVDHF